MRKTQRLAAVGAMAALVLTLGACGAEEEPSPAEPAAPQETSSPAAAPTTTTTAAAGAGVTTVEDIFGPACDQVPTEGEGSAQGMIDDPVATAASNNPLLETLTAAVEAAMLGDTLNMQEAITVYAPANDAFTAVQEALGQEAYDALLADPEALGAILQYHVVPQRLDAATLVEMGETTQLAGGTVMVSGTPEEPTLMGAGNEAPATVLCGNIPTANATVFVIDTVLMPAAE